MTRKKMLFCCIMICLCSFLFLACQGKKANAQPQKDLDFQIVMMEQVPQEVTQMIEEKKQTPFSFTYKEEKSLYICVGYGEKNSGGYSITVEHLSEAENAVYVKTNLIGPNKEDFQIQGTSYPCLVIQTEDIDKAVVFE